MTDPFPLKFTIRGRPIVWKNSKGGFVRLGGPKGQPCPRCKTKLIVDVQPSDAARRWMKSAIEQLERQWVYKPIPKSILLNAEIVSYMPTKQTPDASNLYQGPEDAMVEAGILEDDVCIASHDRSRRVYDKGKGRVDIILTRIDSAEAGLEPDPAKVEVEF